MDGNYSITNLVPFELPSSMSRKDACYKVLDNGNESILNNTLSNISTPAPGGAHTHEPSGFHMNTVITVVYSLVYIVGTIGNGLVMFVILRFPKMKTVTNTYILNLALADMIFLSGLPFLIVSLNLGYWIFGDGMCKLFYCSFGINIFTGVFFICVMSADRYLAVCYPMKLQLRTKLVSYVTVGCVWIVSFVVMIPIFLYSSLSHSKDGTMAFCHIQWPNNTGPIPGHKAFIWYSFLLAFVIPLAMSSVFYIMVVIRLKHVGPANRSREKKKRTRKITVMVLSVIAVYFCCWLPYWVFQAWLVLPAEGIPETQPFHLIVIFNALVILSYSNSMLNPILYAFMSENFRRAFIKAFRCACGTDFDQFRTEMSVIGDNSTRHFISVCTYESCMRLACCRRQMLHAPIEADHTDMTRIPCAREANGFFMTELVRPVSGQRVSTKDDNSDDGIYLSDDGGVYGTDLIDRGAEAD